MATVREKKSGPSPNRFRTFKRKISEAEDEDGDEAPPRKISVFSLGIGEEDEARPRKISVFSLGIGEEDESPPSAIMNEDDLPALPELIVQTESPKPEPGKSPKRARPKSEPMESPERPRPKLEAKESPKRAKPEPEPTESPEQAKPEIELKPPGCVKFGNVEVFKFHFTQGLDTVPSLENGTPLSLGMEEKHHAKYTFKVSEYANYKHNEKQFKYKQEGKIEENQGSQIHHQHNFFNRLDERYRRMLLIKEGVQIDEAVVNETRKLMKSREQCGCRCTGGRCRPKTCECAKNGIECQIDVQDEDNITNNFPCICTVDGCQNPFGRIQLDQLRIRQHQTQTIMRIRAIKKLGSDWDDEKSSPQHTIFRDK